MPSSHTSLGDFVQIILPLEKDCKVKADIASVERVATSCRECMHTKLTIANRIASLQVGFAHTDQFICYASQTNYTMVRVKQLGTIPPTDRRWKPKAVRFDNRGTESRRQLPPRKIP
jgi:hypothetical protein